MDLTQLNTQDRSEEGAVLNLIHPTTHQPLLGYQDQPMTIMLKGVESKAFKEMQYRQSDKAFKGGKLKMSSAQLAESSLQALGKLTVSWTGFSLNNEPLPCTEANAVMVYRDYPVIRNQVDEFINDIENYLGNE